MPEKRAKQHGQGERSAHSAAFWRAARVHFLHYPTIPTDPIARTRRDRHLQLGDNFGMGQTSHLQLGNGLVWGQLARGRREVRSECPSKFRPEFGAHVWAEIGATGAEPREETDLEGLQPVLGTNLGPNPSPERPCRSDMQDDPHVGHRGASKRHTGSSANPLGRCQFRRASGPRSANECQSSVEWMTIGRRRPSALHREVCRGATFAISRRPGGTPASQNGKGGHTAQRRLRHKNRPHQTRGVTMRQKGTTMLKRHLWCSSRRAKCCI